jgi:hypothetical protein
MDFPVVPRFSIGLHIRKILKKKKLKYKGKCFKNIQDTFKMYEGPRWQIPSCFKLPLPLVSKFSSLETIYDFNEIKRIIHTNIKRLTARFTNNLDQWVPSCEISNSIKLYIAKEEAEWNRIRTLYSRLFKFKKIFSKLIFKRKIKKCLLNCKNIEDPVSLEIPKCPVIIIDFKQGLSFVYDAKTLKKTIENRILYSDYMFPEPKQPVNMLTNQPFTLGQYYSIVSQCKKYGETSWILDSLKTVHFDLQLFAIYNRQKLKLEAINSFFKCSTYVIRDIVLDYFHQEVDMSELSDKHIYEFTKTYDTRPEIPIIKMWINHTKKYYIAKELQDPFLLEQVAHGTDTMIDNIYDHFLSY